MQSRLAHEGAERWGPPEPPRPVFGEAHRASVPAPAARPPGEIPEPKKRWDGYRSFSYLDARRGLRPFELDPLREVWV
jgi:hypothetical protein